MKVRERNPRIVAAIAAVVLLVAAYVALDFSKLPLISSTSTHEAYFPTAIGLEKGDVVTIAGVRVGKVSGIALHGNMVKVTFTMSGGPRLGSTTRVDTKIINPVGVEYLEVTPQGPGHLRGPVPLDRTTVPPTFIGDLNQLTVQTQQTDIAQLVKSLDVTSNTLQANPPATTKAAIDGVAQLSAILAARQGEITDLITQTDSLVQTLNGHSGQLIDLIGQAGTVLNVLEQRRQAITSLLSTTSTLSGQLNHILVADRPALQPLLANLASVSSYLNTESGNITAAIPQLAAFSRYAANALGSGPFGDFVAPTLVLPDNLLKQCSTVGVVNPLFGCRP